MTSRSARYRQFGKRNLIYDRLEHRQLLNANSLPNPEVYEPDLDPSVGAVVTSFILDDVQDANDPYDILTGWKAAVDEIVTVGMTEITFAIYRQVEDGNLIGGPTTATVNEAVQYANTNELSVTLMPVFEADGWRGDYDPVGLERGRFQNQYQQWISELATIPGIDRFNIGSELNRMVNNDSNAEFFSELVVSVRDSFESINNEMGRIGYAANFDVYENPQHVALLSHPEMDFLGISAYRSIIEPTDYSLVAGTSSVSMAAFQEMIDNWTLELDRLYAFSSAQSLPVFIQEFGSVQQNYVTVAPFAVDPGDFVANDAPNRYSFDPIEQRAAYESLLVAANGRGAEFESIVFWTWEHQASRGRRTFEQLGTTGVIEKFAIWPTDEGGGQYLSEFLSTENTTNQINASISNGQLIVKGTSNDDVIELTELDTEFKIKVNGATGLINRSMFDSVVVFGFDGDDRIQRLGNGDKLVIQYGGNGNDLLIGGMGIDSMLGGPGQDRLFGNDGDDELLGNAGDDEIHGGNGADRLLGGDDNDVLIGQGENDIIAGGRGNDQLHGQQGADSISGGWGNDILYGGAGNDSLNGQQGDDLIYGGDGSDQLIGQDGNDALYGGKGNDNLFGFDGNDSLYGLNGDDRLRGGNGDDLLNGGSENDNLNGQQGDDRILGGMGDDTLNGQDGNDIVIGGSGNDLLLGGAANDLVIGGTGSDIVRGRAGNDILIGGSSTIQSDLSQWSSPFSIWQLNFEYEQRINELRDGSTDLPINLPPEQTFSTILTDDERLDTVFGDAGQDYFWGFFNEVQDQAVVEIVDEFPVI